MLTNIKVCDIIYLYLMIRRKKMSNTINFPLTEKRKRQLNAEHKQKARDEIKRLIALRK